MAVYPLASRIAHVLIDVSDAEGVPGTVSVQILTPDRNGMAVGEAATDGTQPEVTVPLLEPLTLEDEGIYTVTAKLTAGSLEVVPLPADYFVVEDPASAWHSTASIRAGWADAPEDDVILFSFLTVARREIEEFAPAGVNPVILRAAQRSQVRTHWNASRVDTGGRALDGDGFELTPFPLDWEVKQMLRPRSPRPCFG